MLRRWSLLLLMSLRRLRRTPMKTAIAATGSSASSTPVVLVGCGEPIHCSATRASSKKDRRSAARNRLRRRVALGTSVVIEFGQRHWREAVSAWGRFGKGRHPAGLNFGDCLTYATALVAGEPLLAKGDDFTQTDIPLA